MEYILKNISTPVNKEIDLRSSVKTKFGFDIDSFDENNIIRRAIDARKKNNLQWVFTLTVKTQKRILMHPDIFEFTEDIKSSRDSIVSSKSLSNKHPFIIGMGPAGLFAALKLVENGFQPYIFEKGDCLEKRKEKVELFWQNKSLDENSNVQFGEGGAGAFSDGKLTSRNRNQYSDQVFDYLIRFGADKDIIINALPHIGTDKLLVILKNIRQYLIDKGCKIHYNHSLTDLTVRNSRIVNIKINDIVHDPEIVILATGNSARDIFTMFYDNNLAIESKAFAIGLRVEHPLEYINHCFYGKDNDFEVTGPATYKLVCKNKNRSIYSFCMCPGGFVIPASSEFNGQVVNGMSYSQRNNQFSNSAIVVNVNSIDFGTHPLAGMKFQQELENQFFNNFSSPVQNVKDFINNKLTINQRKNSYFLDTFNVNFKQELPEFISDNLNYSMMEFDRKYKGFIQNGLFLGVETRTSSPVRLLRDSEKYCGLELDNLYPVGEGAGYAGGIISSATDGLKVASIFSKQSN